MATSREAYKSFLVKVNKNDTNTNINVPKGVFVLIFKEQARRWLRQSTRGKESTDRIDDISELLISDEKLEVLEKTDNSVDFKLPNLFNVYVSSYSLATKDITYTSADGEFHRETCKGVLFNWNTKPKDVNNLLIGENTKPSFEYEETILAIRDGKIKVYISDFDIENVFLSYYREPFDIDIAGYKKADGTISSNIDPLFSDSNLDEILNRCAEEVARSYGDTEGLRIAKDRISTED